MCVRADVIVPGRGRSRDYYYCTRFLCFSCDLQGPNGEKVDGYVLPFNLEVGKPGFGNDNGVSFFSEQRVLVVGQVRPINRAAQYFVYGCAVVVFCVVFSPISGCPCSSRESATVISTQERLYVLSISRDCRVWWYDFLETHSWLLVVGGLHLCYRSVALW